MLFKRLKKGQGFSHFSAGSWNEVLKILQNCQGIGCRIEKGNNGNWFWIVDGTTSDVDFPDASPIIKGLGVGTEIPGRVVWDTSGDIPVFAQYTLTWNGSTFDESETPTAITMLTTHEAAHGVT